MMAGKMNHDFNDLFKSFFEEEMPSSTKEDIIGAKNISKIPILDPKYNRNPTNTSTNQQPELPKLKNALEKRDITEEGSPPLMDNTILQKHSHEVDDILNYVPTWMIRWGISVIGILIIGILIMSYYIKYPDIVPGQITISSAVPPISLITKNSGALLTFKTDKETLKKGDIIALIKNDTKYEDLLILKEKLNKLKEKLDDGSGITHFQLPEYLDLGVLQNAFSELILKIKNHQLLERSKGNDYLRKSNLDRQISELRKIGTEQRREINFLEKEYLKAKKIYKNRYLPLFESGSISAEQLEKQQTNVNYLQNNYQSTKSGLNENRRLILNLEAQKTELDYSKKEIEDSNLDAIIHTYGKLVSDIKIWENNYLLIAPIDGKLNYLHFVKKEVYVKPEQELASIIPFDTNPAKGQEYIGELFVTSHGVGKVEIGQKVNIMLNAYKRKEYGLIEGTVHSISEIGTPIKSPLGIQTAYKIKVNFEKGLVTTRKIQIEFKHNMKGYAEVITKDARLIERIFNEISNVFKKKIPNTQK